MGARKDIETLCKSRDTVETLRDLKVSEEMLLLVLILVNDLQTKLFIFRCHHEIDNKFNR